MKLVKAVNSGIVTSLDGILYHIGEEAIEVTDEVASTLNMNFGHLIEIIDKPEEIKVEEKIVEVVNETKTTDSIISTPELVDIPTSE